MSTFKMKKNLEKSRKIESRRDRSWGLDTCTEESCYCESVTKKNGCGLLHGQGRSFVPYKKNVGFSTVWQTVLNFEWQEFNTTSRNELKKELFEQFSR